MEKDALQTYTGGCHCGAVRFEIKSASVTSVVECNCSHCAKKGLLLMFMPLERFTLVGGEDQLTEYRFNNKTIAHRFCKVCGVQPFAFGQDREGNKNACINVRCIDGIDLSTLERTPFNGKDM